MTDAPRPRALIFPGQGSQYVGMGRQLLRASAASRDVFEAADALLGIPLTALCFEGPDDALQRTEVAQPAVLVTEIAALAALAGSLGGVVELCRREAVLLAGHSLGHFSALVASGALSFPDALTLVRSRGEAMAVAADGAMMAVLGLTDGDVADICREASQPGEPVVVANENAPGQVVVSGSCAAVRRVEDLAQARGAVNIVALRTDAAFHSPLMARAASHLALHLRALPLSDAIVPVVSNATATPLRAPSDIRADLLAHATAPVRWRRIVTMMAEAGVRTFVEVGPGAVLSGLIRRTVPRSQRIRLFDDEDGLPAWKSLATDVSPGRAPAKT